MIFLQGQTKGRPFSGGGILNSPTTRGHFSDVQETELPRTPVNSHGLPSRSLHCPVGHAVPRDPPVWSTVMAWVTLGLGVLRLAVAKGKLNLGVPQSFICLEHWNAPTNRSYQKDHVCAQITGCRKPGPWGSLSHSSQALQAAKAEASPGCPAACALQHWAEPPSTQLWPGSRACCLWAPWGRSCRVGTSTPAGLPPGETSWGASALPPSAGDATHTVQRNLNLPFCSLCLFLREWQGDTLPTTAWPPQIQPLVSFRWTTGHEIQTDGSVWVWCLGWGFRRQAGAPAPNPEQTLSSFSRWTLGHLSL